LFACFLVAQRLFTYPRRRVFKLARRGI